jgi:SAM-dependent methyltransferase
VNESWQRPLRSWPWETLAPPPAPESIEFVSEQPMPTSSTGPILDAALRMLTRAMPDLGHLADAPCGGGHLSVRAARPGWKVSPFDIDPDQWRGGDVASPAHLDLNRELPLPTDAFDAVACCEGLEHLENPWLVLREFQRIARPGGAVVITIPNTVDIRQRMRILRRGFYGHYLPKVPDHINMIGTFGLCHALLRTGYSIEAIDVAKVYGGPIMRAFSRLLRFPRKSRLPDHVRAMLSSPRVLCGRTVVVVARVESG